MSAGLATETADRRIARLNAVSQQRVIEPDVDVPGELSQAQVLPTELLSVAGLDVDLTEEQLATLSREELASILDSGIRFEAALEMGLGLELLRAHRLTDPRVTYLLHEAGEETRHQRLFVRLLGQTGARARNPLQGGFLDRVLGRVVRWVVRNPATFYTLVLAGEEIPDLLQRLAAEHPATDPFLAAVNRYHRSEEARHLSFARIRLGEVYPIATPRDRWAARHVAPRLIVIMFATLVHPGVYATVGLPPKATWKAANRSPQRRALRAAACRQVLDAAAAAGVIDTRRVPRPWRRLIAGADPDYVESLTSSS